MKELRKVPELILWYRLLHAKMFRKLFHFYGTVWIVSAGLVSISLVMLFQQGPEATSRYGPDWIWIIGCVFALCWGYGIAKIFGSVEVNIFSVVVPALVLGMPEAGGDLNWIAIAKGAGVFIGLIVLTFIAYSIAPFPYSLVGYRGWPHRRAMTFILLVAGIIALELLRVVIGLAPNLRTPWQPAVASFTVEPGWSYAICLWLWFNIAYLLSNYDAELLPPLLRRIGVGSAYEELGIRVFRGGRWGGPVPDQLSPDDAYMIDYLLVELPNRPDL